MDNKDAKLIAKAIDANTQELREFRRSLEKSLKPKTSTVIQNFSEPSDEAKKDLVDPPR